MNHRSVVIPIVALLAACTTAKEPAITIDLGPRANKLQACMAEPADAVACGQLGRDYQLGEHGEIKLSAAETMYRRACDGRVMAACMALGVLLSKSAPMDAWPILSELCALPKGPTSAGSCYAAGMLVYDGKVTGVLKTQSVELFDKACQFDDGMSCFNYAYALASFGPLGESDPAIQPALERACELGSPKGCEALELTAAP